MGAAPHVGHGVTDGRQDANVRIVSLVSSATEILCALGLGESLVGRSHECDFPEWVKALPVCTEPKFDVTGSSADIDRRVKETLQDSGSVYRVFANVLNDLAPDLIVTQSQCDVCAVSLRDVEAAVRDLVSSRPTVVALQPNALADIWSDIGRVADAASVPDRGEALTADMQSRMRAISDRANHWGRKPTVACIEWIEPLMAAGNWVPELIALAGGINLFGEAGKHSPRMTFDDLIRSEPDVIAVMPCGFDLPRTRAEMPALENRPEWRTLKAVRNGRAFVCDGNAYFNRPGPRLVDALEMLAEAIVPGAFAFGHAGMQTI